MPQVLAGLLGMDNIALHAITQGEVYLETESGGSWSAGVWVDLPVTITVPNVPAGAKALSLFNSSMRSESTGHRFELRAVIDGAAYPLATITTESDGSGRYSPAACVAFVSGLSAGTHTFKVQARSAGNAARSYWSDLRHVVAVMKR